MTVEHLVHNRVTLALHRLSGGTGRPLLILHGLGEASPTEVPAWAAVWTGPVYALDFTGHGASTLPVGGGYTAELLMADADAAIAHLGEVTIVGRGLGGYIALLIAGARAEHVHGMVIADGPGISGGPSVATSQPVFSLAPVDSAPDPYALFELGRDLRPPDYATAFVRLALQDSDLETPILVTARFRPEWLKAVIEQPGVAEMPTIDDALTRLAAAPAT
jgi:pimeloyl-ACP methyl ester carboxylesterase